MADLSSNLDTISPSQSQKEVSANALFDAHSPSSVYGRRASTSSGLVLGYYGGKVNIGGTITEIANGTLTLTASSTNYVEADASDGSVSFNTTAFTAGAVKLYTVVTGTATVTDYTDERTTAVGFLDSAPVGSPTGAAGGDLTGTYPNPTLATVNANVGTFGSATKSLTATVNGKGLITGLAEQTVTPAIGSVTGLGTGVSTFLATPSSANLASALTDETGSGAAVFATSPTLVTPVLGTPASGNLSNCTADGTNAVGFRHVPQNSQSAAYTTVLSDAGKHLLHPSADANARTFTIDSNANVAYPVGTAITFVNQTSQVLSIAITTDTLTLAGSTTTGTRSLAQNGVATALKVASTGWIISGTGLT